MEINQVCPKTWLVESILVTIFCCLPFGIAGIIYATKVTSFYAAGNQEEAIIASANAKKWTLIGAIIGLVGGIIYGIMLAVGGLASIASMASMAS